MIDLETGAWMRAALGYAERGWPVLPVWWPEFVDGRGDEAGRCACGDAECGSAGKHPLGLVARHGVLDATTEIEQIERWWGRFPLANVGVATGDRSGVVVIDIDARHDGASRLAAVERRYLPLPRTVEAETGGGGRHLYFAHRDGEVPSAVGIVPGVDVRGEGGYVVAPPSLHASGLEYAWLPGQSPVELAPAALPAWLADLARHQAEPSRVVGGEDGDPERPRRPLLPATPADRLTFQELMAEVGVHPGGREQEMHRCPWHDDRHPSLSVHWGAAVFHCFGCEVGGGIGTLRRLVAGEEMPW